MQLVKDGEHVYLPFTATTVVLNQNNGAHFQSGTSTEGTRVTHSMNRTRIFYIVSPTEPRAAKILNENNHTEPEMMLVNGKYMCSFYSGKQQKTYITPWPRASNDCHRADKDFAHDDVQKCAKLEHTTK